MSYTTVVSTERLAANLERWAVIDCRFDLQRDEWGREQYLAAHVPGAVYASLGADLAGAPTGSNGRHPLPSVESLARTFARFGIDRHTQVVAYDQDSGLYASRLWWSLKYLGHDAVALLDGGWARWVREGRLTRSGDEVRAPAAFTSEPRPQMQVPIEDVMAHLDAADTLLIDARGAERYEGRAEPLDRVAGHIPGAANHFYRWNLADDGTLLPADQLRERFTALLGGRVPDQAVVYCGSGVSACHNLLAMQHAGLGGARLFVGSWSEWSSDPARPVEHGPDRTPRSRHD